MHLSVDTTALGDYGSACAGHAADLDAAADRLKAVGLGSADMFGPVGGRFLASLTRAVGDDAARLLRLGNALSAGTTAAHWSASAYRRGDDAAEAQISSAF